MTPEKAIQLADAKKPNMMAKTEKYFHLNEIEGRVYREILMMNEHPEDMERPTYTEPEEGEEQPEMLVPDDYAMLYVYWLMCQIDVLNQEMEKYNNDRTLFEDAWGSFGDYWIKTHMPLTARPCFRI